MDGIQAFDALFTTNHIQMLKLLLPYLPPEARRSLAILIKAGELRYTLDFIRLHPFAMMGDFGGRSPDNPEEIFRSLLPFCTPAEKDKLQQMQAVFRNMENMQEMMQTLEALREIMPEFASDDLLKGLGGEGGMDLNQIIELLKGMSGNAPEQS